MRFGFISSLLLLHSPSSFRISTSTFSVMSTISEVQVKKLSEHAVVPTRGSVFAAGMSSVVPRQRKKLILICMLRTRRV
jgi:hypothetical protein